MLIKLNRKRGQKGFTLIELMIVIAIIGILAAIAIPNFLSYRTRGADAAAKSEASSFYTCVLAYVADKEADITTINTDSSITGWSANSDVTDTGSFAFDTSAGTLTGTMTFDHSKGDTSYTLDGPTGAITE